MSEGEVGEKANASLTAVGNVVALWRCTSPPMSRWTALTLNVPDLW